MIPVDLVSLTLYRSFDAKELDFILDNGLKLNKQINSVVSSSFYHLQRLAKVKPFQSRKSYEIEMHAFDSSWLDYCSSLYHGLHVSSINRLQLVQNVAARLLMGSHKWSLHHTYLSSLHWLPIHYRIEFQILLFL